MVKTIFPRTHRLVPRLEIALMLPFTVVVAITVFGHFILAQAADAPTLAESLMSLFTAIKDKAIVAVVLMNIFRVLRTHEVVGILGKIGLQGKGLQLAIAIITTLGFVFDAWARGGNLLQAIIEGLFVAGGANLIFDASKATSASVAQPLMAATGGNSLGTSRDS